MVVRLKQAGVGAETRLEGGRWSREQSQLKVAQTLSSVCPLFNQLVGHPDCQLAHAGDSDLKRGRIFHFK